MTQQKPIYTHIQVKAHTRPVPVANTTITGSRFIKDTKSLIAYCRQWLAVTKGESFNCLCIPTAQTYILFDLNGNVHFVQFAYQKNPLSPTQVAFRVYLKRLGHTVRVFNTFQAFAAFVKGQSKTNAVTEAAPVKPQARLTAWGIQLPVETII